MFDNLTQRLKTTFKSLSGVTTLNKENIQSALDDVRKSLLEADVALPVVKSFIAQVQEEAIGTDVAKRLNASQAFLKIVEKALIKALGESNSKLLLNQQPPASILMAGLQGAGKTTSVAKLALHIKKTLRKSVMVVSVDIYRPAAIEQLKVLAEAVGVEFFPSDTSQNPIDIVKNAKEFARKKYIDVLIVDTAGRLHVDQTMMEEIIAIHKELKPVETLFTVDAMTGQDAANTAKSFNQALDLTGVILTKLDGDSRGGAALSVYQITGKPIKFVGMGEKTDALEVFHPDRIASRILDMGDVLTLIEQIEERTDRDVANKAAAKIKKGASFDLNDFLQQLEEMNKIGGVSGVMDKLPGMGDIKSKIDPNSAEKQFSKSKALIQSMTLKERKNPEIIKASRKLRIAKGAGYQVQDLNAMLNQFEQLQKVLKMFKGGGMKDMMRNLGGMLGKGGRPF